MSNRVDALISARLYETALPDHLKDHATFLRRVATEIKKRVPNTHSVYLHGSRARGDNADDSSDWDFLAVVPEKQHVAAAQVALGKTITPGKPRVLPVNVSRANDENRWGDLDVNVCTHADFEGKSTVATNAAREGTRIL